MPPASLSTFAVMNPGPTTARNSRIRVFQSLRNLMRTFRSHKMKAIYPQRPDRINALTEFGQTNSAPGRGIPAREGLLQVAERRHTSTQVTGPPIEPRLQKNATRRFARWE